VPQVEQELVTLSEHLSSPSVFNFLGTIQHILKKSLKIPNQNPYIEEEQTTQWPKENVQKDKQRSTKHTRFSNSQKLKFLMVVMFFAGSI
jgi:hypothetical protein